MCRSAAITKTLDLCGATGISIRSILGVSTAAKSVFAPAGRLGVCTADMHCQKQQRRCMDRERSITESPAQAGARRLQRRAFRPTAAAPCFTASMAYSIWWMRPCGLHVTTSVSYCTGQGVEFTHVPVDSRRGDDSRTSCIASFVARLIATPAPHHLT